MCHLTIKGHEQTQQLLGYEPAFIHVPLSQVYLQQLAAQSLEFQCAIADFIGGLEINLLSDKLLQNIPFLQIRLAEKILPMLIIGVRTVMGLEKPDRLLLPGKGTKTGEVLYSQDIPLLKGLSFSRHSWPCSNGPRNLCI